MTFNNHWLTRGAAIAVVAGLAGVAMPAPSAQAAKVEGPKVEWNFSAWGKPRGASKNFEKMAELVSEATDGKFTITIHWGEALAASKENLDGLKIGAFEMAMHAVPFRPGTLPTLEVLGLPFLPLGDLHNQGRVGLAVYDLPTAKKDLSRWGVRAIMPLLLPPYRLMGKGEPPVTTAAVKGMRVRAPGGLGDALRKLDAVPTSLPSPELYSAMERGLVDAISMANYALRSYRIYELADWYAANLDLGILATVIPANADAFNALPPQYQKLLLDSVQQSLDYQAAEYEKAEKIAIDAFKEKGLKAITYSDKDLAEFQTAAGKPVWNDWVAAMNKKGYPGQEILDFTLAQGKKGSM